MFTLLAVDNPDWATVGWGAAVLTFLTWFVTKGVTGINDWRSGRTAARKEQAIIDIDREKARAEIDMLEDAQIGDGLKHVIRKQDRRITTLEDDLKKTNIQLQDCLRHHSAAETRTEFQQETITELRQTLERYRNELKQYREGGPT